VDAATAANVIRYLTGWEPMIGYQCETVNGELRILSWPEGGPPRPTDADLAAAAASPGYAAWVLRQAQDARAAEIDARTDELERLGFEWPVGSGQRFDLTPAAQNLWNGLMTAALAGMLALPRSIGVIGDGTVTLASPADVQGFCRAALERGAYLHEGAADIKRLVYAAASVEAVAAVVDNRE